MQPAAAPRAPPSGGIAPSKSTVYCCMLPFRFTNNDVAQLFEPHGKLAKVTILRDKTTRRSRGVAFVQFVRVEDAQAAVAAKDGAEVEGFILRCSIANDNGRAPEFIRRRKYTDKSRCFECGEEGHLSYRCPRNTLGERQRPQKESKRRRREGDEGEAAEAGAEVNTFILGEDEDCLDTTSRRS